LGDMDFDFEVDSRNDFEEKYDKDVPVMDIPALMSKGKSHGFHRPLNEDEILLTSDTMVRCGDVILGKPRDRADAIRMLRLLSGRRHEVITAFTLRDTGKEKTFTDVAAVYFRELEDAEIEYYVDKYKPFDKAGAYAVQEWIGLVGITGIEGSFYTIMGLPSHRVYKEIMEF
ncbi:septum formation protein Maf, partial [gut metagenome]